MEKVDLALLISCLSAIATVGGAVIQYVSARRTRRRLVISASRGTFLGPEEDLLIVKVTNVGGDDETIISSGVRDASRHWEWGEPHLAIARNQTVTVALPIGLLQEKWPDTLGKNAAAFVVTASGKIFFQSLPADALKSALQRTYAAAEHQARQ